MENTVSAINYDKKTLRKEINKLSRILIYLELLTILIFIGWLFHYFIQELSINNTFDPEKLINAMKSQEWFLYMWYFILGTLIICIYRKEALLKDIRFVNRKMDSKVFWFLVLLFLGGQFAFVLLARLTEAGFNVFGYSIQEYIDSVKIPNNPSLGQIINTAFIGPIFEEILFRGAILKALEKYGKIFAIVISSLLFGLMHMHLFQSIYAAVVGLILGYVTIEYSIKWAMLLHILNNSLLGIVYNSLLSGLNPAIGSILHITITSMLFIAGLGVLYKHRLALRQYLEAERSEAGIYKHTFKSVFLIAYILINIAVPFILLTGKISAL